MGIFKVLYIFKYYKQSGGGLETFALGREAPVSIVGAIWPQKLHGWATKFISCARNKLTVYITWYLQVWAYIPLLTENLPHHCSVSNVSPLCVQNIN